MLRWTITASYLALNLVLIELVWGHSWLSHDALTAALFTSIVGWAVSSYFLFRYLGLTTRQKVAGWVIVAAVAGFSVARTFSRHELFAHDSWLKWFLWNGVGLLFIVGSIGLAILITGTNRLSTPTPYTVESEVPDHVVHLSATGDRSVARTSDDTLR
jgi:hypothetical protein